MPVTSHCIGVRCIGVEIWGCFGDVGGRGWLQPWRTYCGGSGERFIGDVESEEMTSRSRIGEDIDNPTGKRDKCEKRRMGQGDQELNDKAWKKWGAERRKKWSERGRVTGRLSDGELLCALLRLIFSSCSLVERWPLFASGLLFLGTFSFQFVVVILLVESIVSFLLLNAVSASTRRVKDAPRAFETTYQLRFTLSLNQLARMHGDRNVSETQGQNYHE
ncbi:hypothetical protein B0J17DRAFT_386599 [Rhizoctonia solani]|nr:hypothetical protein B0J17DRAFT_386599 [Rhizoctonia solani]